MSCFFSSKSSPSRPLFTNIRVVHLNGLLEEFDDPLPVREVTGTPSKHFVFTYAQLLSAGSEYLKQDEVLEAGKLYFMIPYSSCQDVSALDCVHIARRLAGVAKKGQCYKGKSNKRISSPAHRFSKKGMEGHTRAQSLEKFGRKSWKPVLSSIREMSFNKRSESDSQNKCFHKQNSCSSFDIVPVPV